MLARYHLGVVLLEQSREPHGATDPAVRAESDSSQTALLALEQLNIVLALTDVRDNSRCHVLSGGEPEYLGPAAVTLAVESSTRILGIEGSVRHARLPLRDMWMGEGAVPASLQQVRPQRVSLLCCQSSPVERTSMAAPSLGHAFSAIAGLGSNVRRLPVPVLGAGDPHCRAKRRCSSDESHGA